MFHIHETFISILLINCGRNSAVKLPFLLPCACTHAFLSLWTPPHTQILICSRAQGEKSFGSVCFCFGRDGNAVVCRDTAARPESLATQPACTQTHEHISAKRQSDDKHFETRAKRRSVPGSTINRACKHAGSLALLFWTRPNGIKRENHIMGRVQMLRPAIICDNVIH